jgi:hypothetical protein
VWDPRKRQLPLLDNKQCNNCESKSKGQDERCLNCGTDFITSPVNLHSVMDTMLWHYVLGCVKIGTYAHACVILNGSFYYYTTLRGIHSNKSFFFKFWSIYLRNDREISGIFLQFLSRDPGLQSSGALRCTYAELAGPERVSQFGCVGVRRKLNFRRWGKVKRLRITYIHIYYSNLTR